MALTEGRIKDLRPRLKRYRMLDSLGLYIEVLPSGSKSWRLKYAYEGRTTNKSLGRWPDISLDKARELAFAFKNGLREGRSPEEQEMDRAVFRNLYDEWEEKFLPRYSPKEIETKKSIVKRFLLPHIGDVPVKDLAPRLLLTKILRPIEASGRYAIFRKVKSILSLILRYGVAAGYVERDFTQDLRGVCPVPPPTHRATLLDPGKIGRLIRDIRSYEGSQSVKYALNILPYVFVRPGELRHAVWSEVDLEEKTWRIPAEKMKSRHPHTVPLSDQAARLMAELKAASDGGPYLFPGLRSRTKPISDVALTAALRYLGYSTKEICPHGFRAMASTLLNEQGYPADWIERQLAHSERNTVRAAYNHAQHLPERRKMMQAWADYLDHLAEDIHA